MISTSMITYMKCGRSRVEPSLCEMLYDKDVEIVHGNLRILVLVGVLRILLLNHVCYFKFLISNIVNFGI